MILTNKFNKLTMIAILRALTNNYLWSLYPFETNEMHNKHPVRLPVCYQPSNIKVIQQLFDKFLNCQTYLNHVVLFASDILKKAAYRFSRISVWKYMTLPDRSKIVKYFLNFYKKYLYPDLWH